MDDYSSLNEGKNWTEKQIQQFQTENEIEIGKWINPNEWKEAKHFWERKAWRGDVGLEIFINQNPEPKVLIFNETDIKNAPESPKIQQEILRYIHEELS